MMGIEYSINLVGDSGVLSVTRYTAVVAHMINFSSDVKSNQIVYRRIPGMKHYQFFG
jgi:hypothetical protein